MRTLTFVTNPSVIRQAVTTTVAVGADGFTHLFNDSPRPQYRFTVAVGPLIKSEAECLSALHAYLQGDRPFLWDGGLLNGMADFNLVGEGDGSRRQFHLPHRYIGAVSSVAVRTFRPATAASSTAAFTVWLNAGLISLDTSPASGDHVQAKYTSYYRVNFAPEGLRLDQIATDLYTAQFDLIEKP